MNTRTFGILLGFVVVGIAMTGGAAAADSTNVNELGTTTLDADAQSVSETPFQKCCCCDNWAISTVKDLEADTQSVSETPFDKCCCCNNWAVSTVKDLEADTQSVSETPFQKCCCCNNWAIGTVKDLEADARSVSETPFDCCCCPMELGVAPSDEARIAFVAGVEA